MTRTSRRCLVLLLLGLPSCGGSPGAGPAQPSGGKPGGEAANPAIGDIAASKGGLSALGGAGNREEEPPPSAVADTFRLDLIEPGAKVKLDGVLGEWPARIPAKTTLKGSAAGTSFAVALQYDENRIYVAGEVAEKSLVRTEKYGTNEDHASLLLAFPTGGTFVAYEIGLFAGKDGEIPGQVRFLAGGHGDISGAKIIEAPSRGGYSFEAQIPWSAFPEARTVRVGLRGAARYYDAEGGAVAAIVATGGGSAESPQSLPRLPTETEQSIMEGLLIPKGLSQTPRAEVFADVNGDAMKERVAVYDRFFTVAGPSYRGGREFFFRDLGAELVSLHAQDLTGRGKDDVVVRRKFTVPGQKDATREWFEVWSFAKSDEPITTFAHEIAVGRGGKRVANAVHVGAKEIEVSVEPASGWDAASYQEPPASDVEPILLPWGAVKSQSYRFDGTKFAKSKEVPQTPTVVPQKTPSQAPAAEARLEAPPTPPVRKGGDMSKDLFDKYKSDRGLSSDTKPRFDLAVHVDGDPRPERVLLVGREIVVFGPGFRNGAEYLTLTLQQFGSDADIKDLSARDLTGDGGADLVIRGVRHVSPPGAGEPVDLDVTFIYEVHATAMTRIFAIETAREQGNKRVQGLVQFVPAKGGKSFEIDVRPGTAKGWTEKNFPWGQDQPGGAIEPLLLPWGKIPSVRYAYDGTKFTKK